MSMDFNRREPETSVTDAEGLLFPQDRAWERNRKPRGLFGGKRQAGPRPAPVNVQLDADPAPRSPEPSYVDPRPAPGRYEPRSYAADEAAIATPSTLAADEMIADETLATPQPAPVRRETKAHKAGPSPAVIALALGAVVVLGGIGFYALQPRDGVPTLAPGETAETTEVASLPAAPPSEVNSSTNTLPQRAAPAPTRMAQAAPPSARIAAPRVRPARAAAAPSASDNAANVSATLPDSPQPYTAVNPSAPTQVTPPPAPVQATPAAPAPTETAPAIPATPPVQSAPAPTEAQPTPPETPPSA